MIKEIKKKNTNNQATCEQQGGMEELYNHDNSQEKEVKRMQSQAKWHT